MQETDQEFVVKRMNIYGGQLLFPRLGNLCEHPAYGIFQYFRCQFQLYQIIGYLIRQGIPCHLEVFIAGEDDKIRAVIPIAFSACFRKLQTVHDRHFNVRDHDVSRFFFNNLQRRLTVHGSSTDLNIHFVPVQHGTDSCLNQRFIIYN